MTWEAAWGLAGPGLAAGCVLMLVLWLVQLRTGNAGIVDFGWAALLGSLAVGYAVFGPGWGARRAGLAVIGGLWGYRLAWHLFTGRVWGVEEEGRYVTLRRNWTLPFDLAFLVFFQAQALLAVALSAPFLFAAFDPEPGWRWTDIAGVALWLTGWVGESIADRQLERFKRNPANRGRTCRVGLWAWSRHPNYFFEWVLWCGFAVYGLGVAGSWVGLAAPAILLYLILRVTGIPPTEAQALKSRGDDYRDYQRTTSAFFPRPPGKEAPL